MSAAEYDKEKLAPGLEERRFPSGKVVYASFVYADGQRFYKQWEGITRTEARRLHDQHRNEVKNEGARPNAAMTLGQLRDEAYTHYEQLAKLDGANGKKPPLALPALGNYRTAWAKRISPYRVGARSIDDLKLSDLDKRVVSKWLVWLAQQNVAPSTQNGTLSALRTVLRYGRDQGVIQGDPVGDVPVGQRPSQKAREEGIVFGVAELERIVEAAHSPRFNSVSEHGGNRPQAMLSNVIAILIYSGLRLSEVAGLRWSDVDMVGQVLTVSGQRARHRADEQASTKAPKVERGLRSFRMLPALYEALLAQLDHETEKKLGNPGDFVFTDFRGEPVRVDQIKSAFRRATRLAGLGEHGPQVARRSFATQVAHQNIPAVEAEAIMGHSAAVFDSNYAKKLREARQLEENLARLSSTGFGKAHIIHIHVDDEEVA